MVIRVQVATEVERTRPENGRGFRFRGGRGLLWTGVAVRKVRFPTTENALVDTPPFAGSYTVYLRDAAGTTVVRVADSKLRVERLQPTSSPGFCGGLGGLLRPYVE